jgi:transposase
MGRARYLKADRSQLQWDYVDLDSQLPAVHQARDVWAFVETLELGSLYDAILSREGVPGRPPADPRVLLALWLYATIEGIGSARALDRACRRDAAYRWLCGGVPVNYHGLSDFRVGHVALLDRLLTESVAALAEEGLVSLDELVHDGTKVRASAGRGSFVGAEGLDTYERAARDRVERLRAEVSADPAAAERRRQAARKRAAAEKEERAAAARQRLEERRREKEQAAKRHGEAEAAKGERKVSTTDPDARMMRFASGETAPGYNIQVVSAGMLIVDIEATDRRNDTGLAVPAIDRVEQRYGRLPDRLLVDQGIATRDQIVELHEREPHAVAVFSPVPEDKTDIKPRSAKLRAANRAKEPRGLQEWRARMATDEGAGAMIRRRLIETVNGHLKNRGMGSMPVRGLDKVRAVALLSALAHNMVQGMRLRLAAAQTA